MIDVLHEIFELLEFDPKEGPGHVGFGLVRIEELHFIALRDGLLIAVIPVEAAGKLAVEEDRVIGALIDTNLQAACGLVIVLRDAGDRRRTVVRPESSGPLRQGGLVMAQGGAGSCPRSSASTPFKYSAILQGEHRGRPAGGSRPNRSCRASQPSTQPGTVADRTSPRIGIARRPSARIGAASAPDPAGPTAASAAGWPPSGRTRANRSPPIPHMCWVVTASTALVAIAASAALPPERRTATPADDARWSTEHTMPLGA